MCPRTDIAVAFRAFFAGEIIAFTAVGVGEHGIEIVLLGGSGNAVGFILPKFIASVETLVDSVGIVKKRTPNTARCYCGNRQGSIIDRMFISILTPLDGIVGSFRLHFKTVLLPFGDNIVSIDGFQGDGAAYAAFHITAERGAFFDGNAADDVGVDVVAVICARVAAPDGNRLLRAVNGNGNPSLSLYAAYIGIQRAAVARVAAVHAGHTA